MMRLEGLFPQTIPTLQCTPLLEIPLPFATNTHAVIAQMSDGSTWVLKKTITPEGMLAETLGYLFCRYVNATTPAGSLFATPNACPRQIWASHYVDSAVELRDDHLPILSDPSMLGRIVAVDLLVGNPDRHDENLLLRPSAQGLDVVAIDFESAWVGESTRQQNSSRLPSLRVTVPPPVEHWQQELLTTTASLAQLAPETLRAFVSEACYNSGLNVNREVLSFLRARFPLLSQFAQQIVAQQQGVQS